MADIKAIAMPKWGLEMSEGTVAKWHVGEGDTLTKGQVIMDIETDKIANEVEADAGGVLKRRMAAEGETLEIGALLAVIADEGASDAEIDDFVANYKSVAVGRVGLAGTPAPEPARAPARDAPAAAPKAAADGKVRATPRAKRLARELGIDLAQVPATGRGGRVSEDDVKGFSASGAGALPGPDVAPAGGEVRASPVARKRALELGVDIAAVRGTRRGGRISKEDVEAAASGAAAPSAQAPASGGDNPVTVEPMNNMRKIVAKRLSAA